MKKSLIEAVAHITDSVGESLPLTFDVEGLKALLYRAAAEEIQAFYQYILPAKFLVGNLRPDVEREFVENAKDELDDHFEKILTRLNQLGADVTPISDLYTLNQVAVGKYIAPTAPYDVLKLIDDNITAEKDAIKTYTEICKYCEGQDWVTFNMSRSILSDEEEHLTDLEDLRNDIVSAAKNTTVTVTY